MAPVGGPKRISDVIQDQILGAWELVSFQGFLPDGRVISPMGRGVTGSIVYAPGYVSVNLMRANRTRGLPDTLHADLPDDQAGPLTRSYMAYSGPYRIDEDKAIITHDFRFCLDPALIGTVQERHVRLFDDKLELSVKAAAGSSLPSALLWRRA